MFKSSWESASKAIMTTDKIKKSYSKSFLINNTKINIKAICKGAGMIEPNMATMLAFICVDIKLSNQVAKTLLNDITDKKCITILRQFIKVHGYTLISKERYINRKKTCVYRLIKVDDKPKTPSNKKNKNIVISFE